MNNDFGQKIKEIRKENNLTQKQFAEKYNVTPKIVSNWENGKIIIDENIIEQISNDFHLNAPEHKKNEDYQDDRIIRNRIYTVSMLALGLLIACTLSIKTPTPINDFEYKAIDTNQCSNSGTSANALFDKKLQVLYLNEIIYCEPEDKTKFDSIEGTLYENTEGEKDIELGSYSYLKNNAITLDKYLKDINITLDNINCGSDIYLEITATNEDTIIVKRIPIIVENSCTE